MTEEKWADQIYFTQSAVDWHHLLFEGTEEDWLKIKNLVHVIHQECLRLPKNLRRKLDRLPEGQKSVLLGDVPSCP